MKSGGGHDALGDLEIEYATMFTREQGVAGWNVWCESRLKIYSRFQSYSNFEA